VPPRPGLVLFITVALLFSGFTAFAQPSDAVAATRAERKLVHAINDVRTARGLRRLSLGSVIQSAAHRWASYLLARDAFYHGSLGDGVTENIAWLTCRRGWARTIVRMWLNSYWHRVALLDRGARRMGVGVATGRWNGYSCVRMAVARFR
jgi:uncharacterized protein YkwD